MAQFSFADILNLEYKALQARGSTPKWAPLLAGFAETESGGSTTAYNPTDPAGGSIGLWQINGAHAPGGTMTPLFEQQMITPAQNAQEAATLWGTGANRGTQYTPWYKDPLWNQWKNAGTPTYPTATEVASWLSSIGHPVTGTTTVGGQSALATLTSSTTSISTTQKAAGFAGVLQFVTKFLNPGSGSGLLTFLNVGKDVSTTLELILGRGTIAFGFLIVGAVGVYMIVRGPVGAISGGIRLLQGQQRISASEAQRALQQQRIQQGNRRIEASLQPRATIRRSYSTINRTSNQNIHHRSEAARIRGGMAYAKMTEEQRRAFREALGIT